jgi:hypothetical protein
MSRLTKPDPKAPWIVERGPEIEPGVLEELEDELKRARSAADGITVSVEDEIVGCKLDGTPFTLGELRKKIRKMARKKR